MRSGKFAFSYIVLCFCLLIFAVAGIQAQTTAFNFQGRLNDGGNAANSNYDLQFKLFDALTGGNQISITVDRANLQIFNGVFSTTLDFGAGAFSAGNRFLEISVRPAGSANAHVILGQRQQILAVPFAVQATNSTNSINSQNAVSATNAQSAANAQFAVNAGNALSLGNLTPQSYARINFANPGDLSATNLGATGYVSVGGNTIQPAGSNGLPKAMLNIRNDGLILQCFNGITGSATENCGFTVTEPLGHVGVYRINFGFSIANRFPTAISRYASTAADFNTVPIIRGINDTTFEVFLIQMGSPKDTRAAPFTIVVY